MSTHTHPKTHLLALRERQVRGHCDKLPVPMPVKVYVHAPVHVCVRVVRVCLCVCVCVWVYMGRVPEGVFVSVYVTAC